MSTPTQTSDTAHPTTPHHSPMSAMIPSADLGNHTPPGAIPSASVVEDSVAGSHPGTSVDPSSSFALHPFLDGETPHLGFIFNLALPFFSPMQYIPDGPQVPLAPDILTQPATHPPVYHLKIVCDHLPDWPVILEYHPEELTGVVLKNIPPITIGDVLSQVHRVLHQRITHYDWAKLDHERKQRMITTVYNIRCSAPSKEHTILMRNDGVKKVDYLLERVWFRGLVRTCDGPEVLKLIVSRRPS